MKKLPRFLLTLTPPMAIAIGCVASDALCNIQFHLRRSIIVLLAVCVMLINSSVATGKYHKSLLKNITPYRWAYYTVLKNYPTKPIYTTDGWWHNKLSFYYMPDIRFADMNGRRAPMLHYLKEVNKLSEFAGSYVIIGSDYYIPYAPSNWILLGLNYGVKIYEVP